jgi:voltage-gated potassium channel
MNIGLHCEATLGGSLIPARDAPVLGCRANIANAPPYMRHAPDLRRRIGIAAALLVIVAFVGTAGFVGIEGWDWFDALYKTVATVTAVGGGEPSPPSTGGKVWTMTVVMIGWGVLTYTLLALMSYVLEGHLGIAIKMRRMQRQVTRMNNHFVLCGYGRVGSEIARDLHSENIACVIIDVNEESLARAAADGYKIVSGSASDLAVLAVAGIDRARGLITAIDNDAENIYVTLSARVLRPDIFIVARANRIDSEPKLRLAGANRIISPYAIAGRRMARLAIRPTAVEFVDTIMSAANAELVLEDLIIPQTWVGRTIVTLAGESEGVLILAIKRAGTMAFRPAGATLLMTGDELVAAGPSAAIRMLEERLVE